jgi:uncharacterized protein YcaQ
MSTTRSLLSVHRLTRAQARRIAVRAQLLDAPRPTDLLGVVQQLTLLQLDPTAAIAPSADLVAWSRLGSAYQPAHLRHALEEDQTLFEHNALIRPIDDVGLYLAGAADWPPYERTRVWLRDNDRFRRDILKLLAKSGPLSSRDIPDTCKVPWASTGWTNNRNVTQMVECLMLRGEVAIAGRVGRERLWDLPKMYKPAAQRRWGYYALPILHGDRLIGKVDATADRKASVLHAVHEDVKFTRPMSKGLQAELEDLASWLELGASSPPRALIAQQVVARLHAGGSFDLRVIVP